MAKRKKQRGPKPNHLKIDMENWEDAVGKALRKEKPPEGWTNKPKKRSLNR